jgi:hypothetical protein
MTTLYLIFQNIMISFFCQAIYVFSHYCQGVAVENGILRSVPVCLVLTLTTRTTSTKTTGHDDDDNASFGKKSNQQCCRSSLFGVGMLVHMPSIPPGGQIPFGTAWRPSGIKRPSECLRPGCTFRHGTPSALETTFAGLAFFLLSLSFVMILVPQLIYSISCKYSDLLFRRTTASYHPVVIGFEHVGSQKIIKASKISKTNMAEQSPDQPSISYQPFNQ